MKEIGARVVDDRTEIILGCVEIVFAFLHPIEAECGGMIFQTVQALHPGGLVRQRDFPKADEDDLRALRYQAGNQLTSIGPDTTKRVSRDQNAHRTPGKCEAEAFHAPMPLVYGRGGWEPSFSCREWRFFSGKWGKELQAKAASWATCWLVLRVEVPFPLAESAGFLTATLLKPVNRQASTMAVSS